MNSSTIFLGSFCILEYYGCRIPWISRMGQSISTSMILETSGSCTFVPKSKSWKSKNKYIPMICALVQFGRSIFHFLVVLVQIPAFRSKHYTSPPLKVQVLKKVYEHYSKESREDEKDHSYHIKEAWMEAKGGVQECRYAFTCCASCRSVNLYECCIEVSILGCDEAI